jgi:cytochrome P450
MIEVPPGPGPELELFESNGARLRRDPLAFLSRMAADYGDLSYMGAGDVRIYLASSPSLAREVLVRRQDDFVKGHGVGPTPSPTDAAAHVGWLHALGRSALRAFDPPPNALRMLDDWPSTVDATKRMEALSLETIGRAIFGPAFDDRTLRRATERYADRVVRAARAPLGGLETPLPVPPDFEAAEADLGGLVDAAVVPAECLLASVRGLAGIDAASAREIALLLLLAGYETVATLLTWTLRLLCEWPQADEVPDLWILSEALRLYPPVWLMARRARRDARLLGYLVPAGSLVLVSPWVIQRSPRFHDEPEAFRPARWEKGAPREAFLPFGLGPRRCIGEAFAWKHAETVLRAMRARWRFRLAEGQDLAPHPMLALRPPQPLWVLLAPRDFPAAAPLPPGSPG